MAIDDWFAARSWKPCSITIAAPGVITSESHGLVLNDKVTFNTTGALPTGLSVSTYYFVIEGTYSDGSTDPDTFKVSTIKNGSALTTSGSQSGAQFYSSTKHARLAPSQESNK